MNERELAILLTFEKAIPQLNDLGKERLLGFAEGLAFKREDQPKQENQCEILEPKGA